MHSPLLLLRAGGRRATTSLHTIIRKQLLQQQHAAPLSMLARPAAALHPVSLSSAPLHQPTLLLFHPRRGFFWRSKPQSEELSAEAAQAAQDAVEAAEAAEAATQAAANKSAAETAALAAEMSRKMEADAAAAEQLRIQQQQQQQEEEERQRQQQQQQASTPSPAASESKSERLGFNLSSLNLSWARLKTYSIFAAVGGGVLLVFKLGLNIVDFFTTVSFLDVGEVAFIGGLITGVGVVCCGWLGTRFLRLRPEPCFRHALRRIQSDETVAAYMGSRITSSEFRAYNVVDAVPRITAEQRAAAVAAGRGGLYKYYQPKRLQLYGDNFNTTRSDMNAVFVLLRNDRSRVFLSLFGLVLLCFPFVQHVPGCGQQRCDWHGYGRSGEELAWRPPLQPVVHRLDRGARLCRRGRTHHPRGRSVVQDLQGHRQAAIKRNEEPVSPLLTLFTPSSACFRLRTFSCS
jgi:hypothetical protein